MWNSIVISVFILVMLETNDARNLMDFPLVRPGIRLNMKNPKYPLVVDRDVAEWHHLKLMRQGERQVNRTTSTMVAYENGYTDDSGDQPTDGGGDGGDDQRCVNNAQCHVHRWRDQDLTMLWSTTFYEVVVSMCVTSGVLVTVLVAAPTEIKINPVGPVATISPERQKEAWEKFLPKLAHLENVTRSTPAPLPRFIENDPFQEATHCHQDFYVCQPIEWIEKKDKK